MKFAFSIRALLYTTTLCSCSISLFGLGVGVGVLLVVAIIYRFIYVHQHVHPVSLVGCLVTITVIGSLIVLLAPALQSSRTPSRRNVVMNVAKQLALSVLNFESATGKFPAAASISPTGEVLHSWRTMILPFVEEQDLYDSIVLSDLWNSQANQKIFEESQGDHVFQQPRYARLPGARSSETHFFAVVDDDTAWPPEGGRSKSTDIADGPSNTILLIEAFGRGVPWYKPRDLTMDEALDVLTGVEREVVEWSEAFAFHTVSWRSEGVPYRAVAFADGHVTTIGYFESRSAARAFLTRDGGEETSDIGELTASYSDYSRCAVGFTLNWQRIFASGLLLVLVIGPAFRRSRHFLFGRQVPGT